jgi:phospholipase C
MVFSKGLSRQASSMTRRSFLAPATEAITCSSATACVSASLSAFSLASTGIK